MEQYITLPRSTKISLIQFATIVISSGILLYRPKYAFVVAIYVGISMAISMGSVVAVGHFYSSRNIEKISSFHATLLGIHFGGIFCYLVMLCKAFEYLS